MKKKVIYSDRYSLEIEVTTAKGTYTITAEKYKCDTMGWYQWYGGIRQGEKTAGLEPNSVKTEFIYNAIDFIKGYEQGILEFD